MIRATIFKNSTDSGNAVYTGIVVEGHAGYAGEGEDIIYAAVLVLAPNFFSSAEVFTEGGFKGGTGEGDSFGFRFISETSPESKLLMNSLILGLQNIERDYGKSCINVRFKEVQYILKMSLQLFAHKKGVDSTRNGRDSEVEKLGIKRTNGQFVLTGNILYRQRGAHIHSGSNVGKGGDDTLFALVDGVAKFERKGRDGKQVSVYPRVIDE